MPSDVFTAMGMSPKVRGFLNKGRIKVLGDLIVLTPLEVMKIKGIGPNALQEIEILLAVHKLALAPRKMGGQP